MIKLRIGTWNVERPSVRGWKRPLRNPVIMEQIRSVNADIWILTETHQVITPGTDFSAVSTSQADYHKDGESCTTIWSRYPIIRPFKTFDPSHAVCAEIQTPVGNIIVHGSIITYAHDKGPDGTSKAWQEHYKSILAHQNEWAKLKEKHLPLCTGGDYNETLNDSGWYGTKKGRRMLEQALYSSQLDCLTSAYKIDHICVSQGWADSSQVFKWDAPEFSGKPVSDHWGYHCDFYFEQAANH